MSVGTLLTSCLAAQSRAKHPRASLLESSVGASFTTLLLLLMLWEGCATAHCCSVVPILLQLNQWIACTTCMGDEPDVVHLESSK